MAKNGSAKPKAMPKQVIHVLLEEPLLGWVKSQAKQSGIKAASVYIRTVLQQKWLSQALENR